MRIEADFLAEQVELVVEVGDLVALVDSATREILAGPRPVLTLPSEITWTVPREGELGWALLNPEADLILYIGDVHIVRRGDLYTLVAPERRPR